MWQGSHGSCLHLCPPQLRQVPCAGIETVRLAGIKIHKIGLCGKLKPQWPISQPGCASALLLVTAGTMCLLTASAPREWRQADRESLLCSQNHHEDQGFMNGQP